MGKNSKMTMNRGRLFLPFLLLVLVMQPALGAEPPPLAFTHVTVIDATGAPAQPDVAVVITGNRITALGKSADTLNPYCLPGFSLHDELGLLVQAGLTPMEALQAATLNPARFMGRENELGTVEKGKLADLVLLDANPLDNIANTRKIAAVVYDGRLFSKSSLDEMLARAEARAN